MGVHFLGFHTPQIAALLREVRALPVKPCELADAVDRLVADWQVHRAAGCDEAPEREEWEGSGPDPDEGRAWRDRRRMVMDLRGGW